MRRQHPIGRFFVDFACVPLRLVIEIDDRVHERDEVVLNISTRHPPLSRC